ncbi:hypothetical protein P7K49_021903 [Saguinus oedipus]|uniref:Prohibitin n=1 Tax=Saguinus oedipus TaxID=9490 RepID=A0ABQ9UUS3_SAGOE|nr:hypothetical protein P7K49_021903 [Saguinus oedipus]
MAAKVFESISKFGLALAVAGDLIVNITLRILFRPVASQLSHIFTSIRGNHDERVLPSITTEILKSVVARFDAGELITWGELVSRQVNVDLMDQAATFGLILDDVFLTHLTFGKEFTEAVEAKQAAIISAEGDSKAAKLITSALATLHKLEAAEDIAYQLSDSRNSTCLVLLQLPQSLKKKTWEDG